MPSSLNRELSGGVILPAVKYADPASDVLLIVLYLVGCVLPILLVELLLQHVLMLVGKRYSNRGQILLWLF